MSEPEIARRCAACGISIRQSALYCPQCGEKINPPPIIDSLTTAAPPEKTGGEKIGVAENVRERVEKIKHVSTVMIDQAAYDPSLRFILVAAVLFVVFLILLILSKVIG